MKKNIVFILSAVQDAHQTSRVKEFINEGYDVKVYGFSRKNVPSKNLDGTFDINIIGEFESHEPYHKRIPKIYKGLQLIVKEYTECKDIVFFYSGLSIAMFAIYMIKAPYIYEECDLLHVSLRSWILKLFLDKIDKRVIEKSIITVLTSKGFAEYHYGNNLPDNIFIITNRLQESITKLEAYEQKKINTKNLHIAFVGSMRYDSIYNFIKVYLNNFPMHDFHLFGIMKHEKFKYFEKFSNFHNHGVFKNPDDLPEIYSQFDIVLCTYDSRGINERYAEPNKLYEAIYFNKPIIVSSNTYLGKKVLELGIGYTVNALNDSEVIDLIQKFTDEDLTLKSNNASKIDKSLCINMNNEFYRKLDILLK